MSHRSTRACQIVVGVACSGTFLNVNETVHERGGGLRVEFRDGVPNAERGVGRVIADAIGRWLCPGPFIKLPMAPRHTTTALRPETRLFCREFGGGQAPVTSYRVAGAKLCGQSLFSSFAGLTCRSVPQAAILRGHG